MQYLKQAPIALLVALAIGGSTIPALAQSRPPSSPKPSPPQSKPSNWQSFRSPTGGFSAQFPGKPKVEKKGPATFFEVPNADGLYLILYLDAPSAKEAQAFLDKQSKEFVESSSFKVTNTRNISLKNNPGKEFDLVTTKDNVSIQGNARVYAVKKRVFILFEVNPDQVAQKNKRFLSAFNLL
jgi:hypothetical protein